MTIASSLAAGRQSIRAYFNQLGNNLNRRRQRSAPMLCEALEQRTLLSAVSVSFSDLVAQNTAAPVTSIVAADLNEDGVLDIAALTSAGQLYVSLGTQTDGKVTYTPGKTTSYVLDPDAANLIVGDFNNDSLLDLAYTSSRGASDDGVIILLGQTGIAADTGSGAFDVVSGSKVISFADNVGGQQLLTANLDINSATDLIFTYKDASDVTHLVSVLGGNDLDAPTIKSVALSGSISSVLVGNADYDTDDDVVYVQNGNTICVSINDGTGTLVDNGAPLTTILNIKALAFGDYSSDSLNDLVVLAGNGDLYLAESHFDIPGTYVQPSTHQIGTFTSTTTQLLVNDVSRDNMQDILGIDSNGTIQIILGAKNNTFQVAASDAIVGILGASSGPVTLADVNGDQSPDLVAGLSVGGVTGQFGVLLNATFITSTHTIDSAHRTFTYVDDNGDTVVVKLTGPGSATIELNDAAKQIATITLTGTTVKSSLSFTITNRTNSKSPKTTTIGAILFTSGQLASLSAANVDFDASLLPDHSTGGVITADESGLGNPIGNAARINSIRIRDLGANCGIYLPGTAAGSKTSLSMRVAGDDSAIYIKQAISSATFVDVGNCDIHATTIGTFVIKGDKKLSLAGDFKGVLRLDGISDSKANTLGSASIAGALVGGEGVKSPALLSEVLGKSVNGFTIKGGVGSVVATSVATTFELYAQGNLTRFVSRGDLNGVLHVYSAGAIRAGGKADDLSIHIENSTGDAKSTLGSLTIAGNVTKLRLDSYSNVGSITTGSMSSTSQINVNGKLTTFHTRGNMDGNLTARSYGTITVDGTSTGMHLTVGSGGVDAMLGSATPAKLASRITFRKEVSALTLNSNGSLGAISAKSLDGTSSFDVQGTLDSIRTTGDCGGTYVIYHVKSWSVGGNLTGATVTLATNGPAADTRMLDTLAVTGGIIGSTIQGYGNIGTITAKTMGTSNIYAGYVPSGAPLDSLDDFNSARTIERLTITGDTKATAASTIAGTVAAATIKNVSLAFPDATTKPTLIAHTITSMTVRSKEGKKIITEKSPTVTGPGTDPKPADNVAITLL